MSERRLQKARLARGARGSRIEETRNGRRTTRRRSRSRQVSLQENTALLMTSPRTTTTITTKNPETVALTAARSKTSRLGRRFVRPAKG
ncbi:hypothetical protein PHMEG_00034217, partial [Phytophthora megakarya]